MYSRQCTFPTLGEAKRNVRADVFLQLWERGWKISIAGLGQVLIANSATKLKLKSVLAYPVHYELQNRSSVYQQ